MKTRILPILLLALLLALVLCGCPSGDSSDMPDRSADVQEPPEAETPEEPELGDLPDTVLPPASAPVSIVLSPTAPGKAKEENSAATIDYSNSRDGYIMVSWRSTADSKLKVLVRGPSGSTYQYNLRTDGEYEAFPLSDGNGEYTVGVYKNTSGTEYATVLSAVIDAVLTDEFAPFIRPNQYVTYAEDNKAVQKAAELCAGISANLDKVEAVYTYVIEHTEYDVEKAQTVQSGYLPDIDQTLASGKGICFDYAALMAAMLRSQGVPVKLVVGYTGSAYHAWLSVYSETDGWIEGKIYFDGRAWQLMDPTFASGAGSADAVAEYIGNGENYSAKYLY